MLAISGSPCEGAELVRARRAIFQAALRGDYKQYRTISRYLRSVERAALIELWTQNEINDEVLRELEQELDLEDARFASLAH